MIDSFYTSSTAVVNIKKGLDVIANNIANVQTDGFKGQNASFSDLVYTDIRAQQNENNDLKSGHGVRFSKADTHFSTGVFKQTGRDLDFAIESDDGFFAVMTDNGIKYTRNGNFNLTEMEDGNFYLTDRTGGMVLDENGNPMQGVSTTGDFHPGVFTCRNRDGLIREDNNFFTTSVTSGEMGVLQNTNVKRHSLEGSGVSLTDEMTNMIEIQRAFQFNSKIVQVADEIMQTVNNMR